MNIAKRGLKIILIFSTGYLCSILINYKELTTIVNQMIFGKKEQKVSIQKNIQKPKFEFYSLLDKEDAPKKIVKAAPKPVPKPLDKIQKTANGTFILQAGTFKNKTDAERLKALLTLQGHAVKIVTNDQTKLYQVIIGPYNSRAEAVKTQVMLAKNEQSKTKMQV